MHTTSVLLANLLTTVFIAQNVEYIAHNVGSELTQPSMYAFSINKEILCLKIILFVEWIAVSNHCHSTTQEIFAVVEYHSERGHGFAWFRFNLKVLLYCYCMY